jgi:hypothetical protein
MVPLISETYEGIILSGIDLGDFDAHLITPGEKIIRLTLGH